MTELPTELVPRAAPPGAQMYLRTPEAAKRLGVSESFLNKRRVYGDGPSFLKLGRSVAYRAEDLDTWARGKLRQNTSEPAQ